MYPFYETKSSDEPFYFSIVRSDNLSFPPHLHSYVEVIFIEEGEISATINKETKLLKEGEIGISFPNDIHSYHTYSESKLILLLFSPEIINSYFINLLDKTLENPFMDKDLLNDKVMYFITLLLNEFIANRNEFIIKGLLYSIFGTLHNKFKFKNRKYAYNGTVQILLKYIESHYTENISLDSISKSLGFNKFYISRLFTKKIGFQLNEYVNKLRINMAQSLLMETDTSIVNIAFECGFESQRNFNRVFKACTSLTPTEFRRREYKNKVDME
ncbi:MAG TPA: AraC family transcriptional regulator [Clostridiaceae bacterium]